jgi:hypothetical protein
MGERNVGHVLQGECITLAKLVRPSTSSVQHVACNNVYTPTIASQDTSALLLFTPDLQKSRSRYWKLPRDVDSASGHSIAHIDLVL